jgi:hypothetical protein
MDILLLSAKDISSKKIEPCTQCALDPDFASLYVQIQKFMKSWATAIPAEKLQLFGQRLETIKYILLESIFEIQYIWDRHPMESEICIRYIKNNEPIMNVSLTPNLILFKELGSNRPRPEIAFPSTWSV